MSWLTKLNAPEESTRLDVRHKAHLEPWSEGQVVVTPRPSGGYEALVTPRFSAKDGLICVAALMMACLFMMGEEGLLTLWIAGELSEMSDGEAAWSMLCVVGALGAIGWLLYRNLARHLLICAPGLLRVEHLAPWRPAHTLYEGGYEGVNLFRDVHVNYSEHGGTSRTAYFILKLPSEACSQVQFDTDATAREMEAVQHVIEHMRAHRVDVSAPSRLVPSAAAATAALVVTRGANVAAYERLRGESLLRRLTAVATMIAFEGHQGAMPGAARRVTFGELTWRSVFAPVRSGAHRCSASIDALHRLLIEDLSEKQRAFDLAERLGLLRDHALIEPSRPLERGSSRGALRDAELGERGGAGRDVRSVPRSRCRRGLDAPGRGAAGV